ncbi:MAG: Fe-S protein assembly co-chaperone HscB [Polyangiaceae bacterium]|nr:Fe-S protein assembly co-chaperone HscB [Polyangiaceae bacterium]
MDPFDLLGIEPRFDLDMAMVEIRHRELSRTLHPDRFIGRPPAERRLALDRAIEVNEAWRIIRNPIARAEALLSRLGLPSDEESAAQPAPTFLMQMMESREALADARATKDCRELVGLVATMRVYENTSLAAIVDAFNHDPKSARQYLTELRYIRRFLDEAAIVEDELL